jgi:hypothetical protein
MLIGPMVHVAALSVRADSTRTQSFVLGVAVPAFMAACASVWQAAKLASVGVSAYTLTAAATRLAYKWRQHEHASLFASRTRRGKQSLA